MAELRDIPHDHDDDRYQVWTGYIAEDASHPNDLIHVVIPDYDPDQTHGPCTFSPRPSWNGGAGGPPLLPNYKDPCIVAFDQDGNAQLVDWWTEDGT
jgi:hypothetical protein